MFLNPEMEIRIDASLHYQLEDPMIEISHENAVEDLDHGKDKDLEQWLGKMIAERDALHKCYGEQRSRRCT